MCTKNGFKHKSTCACTLTLYVERNTMNTYIKGEHVYN